MSTSGRSTIRLQLIGWRQAMAGIAETAGAVTGLKRAEESQGLAALKASERQWLHNQAIFTLRRYAYAGTLALTALIGETVRWGFQFNQTMASSRAALGPVFNDTRALNAELAHLYNFTKYTPFQFKDITTAFRQMYGAFHPLGISVETTNQTIKSMVDSLAYSGRTTPGALNRLAVALQHMAFLGRLTGQTVLQLARDGLPIFPILTKELGLTGEELHRVGALGIPTAQVLAAINKYIATTPGYMDAARRQAMTFGGSLTTLKDNIAQMMGALTFGTYSRGPGFIRNLNTVFDQIGKTIEANARAGRGQSISWDQVTKIFIKNYPFLRMFFRILDLIYKVLRDTATAMRNIVIPALKDALIVLLPLYGALVLLADIFGVLANHGWALRVILAILIGQWLLYRQYLFLVWLNGMRVAAMEWLLITRTAVLTAWNYRMAASNVAVFESTIELTAAQRGLMIVTGLLSRAGLFLFGVWQDIMIMWEASPTIMLGITGGLSAIGDALLAIWAAMGPVGWIILAITALTILYFKWRWFHQFVDYFVKDLIKGYEHWAKGIYQSIAPVVVLTLAISHLGNQFRYLAHWAQQAWRWVQKVTHPVTAATGGYLTPRRVAGWAARAALGAASGGVLGAFQHGGTVAQTGNYLVGETGPEIVSMSRGSVVTPSGGGFNWPDLHLTSVLNVDGKKLAEVTAKHRLDALARA